MAYRWTETDLAATEAGRRTLTLARSTVASPAAPQKARKQKYGNRKVTDAAGNVHDSTKEYRRWCALELRECAGEITRLRRQVPFALVVNGVLVCSYIADFVYDEGEAKDIVEDCKSEPTRKLAAFVIKRKLMQAIHRIQIREV